MLTSCVLVLDLLSLGGVMSAYTCRGEAGDTSIHFQVYTIAMDGHHVVLPERISHTLEVSIISLKKKIGMKSPYYDYPGKDPSLR